VLFSSINDRTTEGYREKERERRRRRGANQETDRGFSFFFPELFNISRVISIIIIYADNL
jgi:hypothetical protein